MTPAEKSHLEQIGIRAELARTLVHECNNFLNTFFLQIALLMEELPENLQKEWMSMKREGKKLAQLLHEVQGYPIPPSLPEKVNLCQVIAETVDRLSEDGTSTLALALSEEPLWLTAPPTELKYLCFFLLRYVILEGEKTQGNLELRLEKVQKKIHLQVKVTHPVSHLLWAEIDDSIPENPQPSLLVITCKSLANRLRVTLKVERKPPGESILIAIFPGGQSA